MCLIFKQGVGGQDGLLTEPSIVSKALPCQTLDIFGAELNLGVFELFDVALLGNQRQT